MPNFVWYLLAFAVQLLLGATIGWVVCRRHLAQANSRERNVRKAFSTLEQVTARVSHDVREHATCIDASNKELEALAAGGNDPTEVAAALGPIIEANDRLQARLSSAEEKLAKQAQELDIQTAAARTDALTGLMNRRGFDEQFTNCLKAVANGSNPLSMLLVDADHFKKFNDRYGHDVGDVVLRELARVIGGAVRSADMVARLGGEELVVLMPGAPLQLAKKTGEKLRAAVATNTIQTHAQELSVTISIGVAQAGQEDAESLLKRTDLALYSAKEGGRNRVHYHDGEKCLPVQGELETPQADPRSDALTHLPNMHSFTEEASRRVAESKRTGAALSLVLIDIDQLDAVTEKHGSRTADLVLIGISHFLKDLMRDMDLIARAEGDSFVILLPNCALADAADVADRLRRTVAYKPLEVGQHQLELTFSAGVASTADCEDVDHLLARGRDARTECKNRGGNRIWVDRGDNGFVASVESTTNSGSLVSFP